ncbi:MAG: hypothetical protein WCS94_23200 [Verrucomicrobiota bacterium]
MKKLQIRNRTAGFLIFTRQAGEVAEKAVCRDFRHTAEDGKEYTTRFYNLDAIIAVGFRLPQAFTGKL